MADRRPVLNAASTPVTSSPVQKSARARQADDLWSEAASPTSRGATDKAHPTSRNLSSLAGVNDSSSSSSRRGLREADNLNYSNGHWIGPANNNGGPLAAEDGRRVGGHSPLRGGDRSIAADAFRAYHNFHQNGGAETIAQAAQLSSRAGGKTGSAFDAANRSAAAHVNTTPRQQQVLEADYFPLRTATQATRMVGDLRSGKTVSSSPSSPALPRSYGPSSYTYTGGFASSVFASPIGTRKTAITEEERREAYVDRHRQAYAALASVKPFLERIFDDEGDEGDGDRATDTAVTSGRDGNALFGAGDSGSQLFDEEMSRALHRSVRSGGGGSSSYTRVDASSASNTAAAHIPAWNYRDIVRRESAKPFLLNTVPTTDRCPLPTKTCPPTYTSFERIAQMQAAAASDREAFAYFSSVGELEAEERTIGSGQRTPGAHVRVGGASLLDSNNRGDHYHHQHDHRRGSGGVGGLSFSSPHLGGGVGAARAFVGSDLRSAAGSSSSVIVKNGAVQSGSLNVGMRAFRDLLLPCPLPDSIASIVSSHGDGKASSGATNPHDEAALLKEAHVASLKWAIHNSKKVSERNHLAAASSTIDYDRW